jgi:lipoteichoic acid synthase
MKGFKFFIFFGFLLMVSSCQESKDLESVEAQNYSEYRQDITRFFAHAGGEIDGNKYTNSKEALDLNYQKGFRYFELDIIATSDSQLVACHDWETWRKQAKFSGSVPVSKKVFLENEILAKYTPLSLIEINAWFQKHEDAILVTDKINNPSLMVNQFVDKNRLMMELFSLEAILEAQELGLERILASEKVLKAFGDQRLHKLLENNIKYVTFSISYMEENRAFIRMLIRNDIKAIVYNLTAEKNEKYLIQNKMDDIFGFYADTWNF